MNALKGHGEVIQWGCCHTWEYNGRRDLPAGATNKTQHRELAEGMLRKGRESRNPALMASISVGAWTTRNCFRPSASLAVVLGTVGQGS